ncbi:hypothetical protein TRFO_37518 [Tritrichomonas foetus]|uniref:Uncharacterized protein n=1 Tax=Tritrichomonas foetus TaxID=1144522 RepID=A0A1J4JAX5_9EUKA|nr:hypothetical protein TRFO_37518 [Tritrichomonas foetus]|eukprot:OHS96304.1 hypothetical protein TRFO_37518 [Tritrichomonas foetus]
MSEENEATTTESPQNYLNPINKDVDLLPGFEKKVMKPCPVNFLESQISVDEAFVNTTEGNIFGQKEEDDQSMSSLGARWSKFKNFCLTSFQTNASDFAKTDIQILFSKRVRDRLAEFAVTSDEAQMITLMQQNEERLRAEIKKQSAELQRLHNKSQHWEMIELISNACQLLINIKSPQFYPAQFMMVLELVECFGKMVYDRISKHTSAGKEDFMKDKDGTRELLALNWSMILCRTSKLLPRLLLQIAFLRSVKFHPFKTIPEAIDQVVTAIPGLGSASSGIYVRTYLIYTIYTYFPNKSCDIILPLFTSYAQGLIHIKERGFKRQFAIIDYSFQKYIETHRPALNFVLSVMVSVGDANFLRTALDEFYSVGQPSSFILSALLDELPAKFISKIYPVVLTLIDKSDNVIPHPDLIHRLVTSLCNATLAEGIMDLMNDIWERMRSFKNVEDFVYVAAPMAKFISKFCNLYYLNLFLANVVNLLRENFAGRDAVPNRKTKGGRGTKALTKKLAECVSECIMTAVTAGQNFSETLLRVGSIVDLMDFLNEASLINISRFILNDISAKPFELNDPLCIRILLELSQTLFQSLTLLSAVDVVEKTNNIIELFLYRVEFGSNIESHMAFLTSARQAFPTSSKLLSCISRIAIRLAASVAAKKPSQYNVTLRSLFAFIFVTVPSITDLNERASLLIFAAQESLACDVICFTHSFYEEFVGTIKQMQSGPVLYQLLIKALNLLILMPTKPEAKDPYQQIRELIIASVRREWPDDECIKFCLDSIVMMSHTLRSEYHIRIRGVSSNDVLFAGNEEFRTRAINFINKMIPRFMTYLTKFGQKGVMAARTKVPALALRAMTDLPDTYDFNDFLLSKMKELANLSMQGDSKHIKELRQATVHHLNHVLATNEKGMSFVKVLASADEE